MFAIVENGVPRELKLTETILDGDRKIPVHNMPSWTPQERATINVFEVIDARGEIPAGKKEVGSELKVVNGEVHRVWVLEDMTVEDVAQAKSRLLRGVRRIALDKIGEVLTPDQQLLIVLTGLEGILTVGLDRAAWPAALRSTFNPLFTSATSDVKAIYQKLKTKQTEITALTTAAQVMSYDVSADW